MTRVVLAGFAAGAAIVLIVFVRELSDGAEKLRLDAQEQAEAEWRLFLQRWEAE